VKDQPREVTAQEDAVLRRAVLRSGKVIAQPLSPDTRAYIASLVAERDELREALRDLVVMLPSDAPERDENERIPAAFVAITWKELRTARKALEPR
jgi:hypothetical protein